MTHIASHSNPKIKLLRALRLRKARDERGLCVVEGLFHIGEALAAFEAGAGAAVEFLCYVPDLLVGDFGRHLVEKAENMRIPVYTTTAEILTAVADKDNPQGILGVVRQQQGQLTGMSPADYPQVVALVAPQDPGNVGTILRTMDATGASGLLLLDAGVDPYHPTAIRASMGAIFWIPVVKAPFLQFAGWAAGHGYHIYGTSTRGAADYRTARYARPFILLMGSEREGLSDEQIARCEQVIALPMRGRVTSLNLAVATGVMLYTMTGQLNA